MTKTSIIIPILLFFFSFTGCNPDKKTASLKRTCIITEKEKEISFDDLVKTRQRIILEQNKDSYLSEIQNVFLFEGNFYLLDGRRKAVLVFDDNGNYKRQIGRTGRGPGELLFPRDFALDPYARSIKILDSQQNKILAYTTKGDFIDETPLSEKYTAFHQFDQTAYLFEREISTVVNYSYGGFSVIDPDDTFLMAYGNEKGKIKFLPLSEQRMLDGTLRYNRNCFSSYNEGVLFWQFFDNTFYYVEQGKLVTTFAVDFLERNIPDDIMEHPFQKRLQLMMSPENYEKYRGLISNVTGHENLIIFSYQSPSGTIFIAWETEQNNTWRIIDEALNLEDIALFKVSDNRFISIGFSDYTSETEPQLILTLFEM